MYLTLKELRHDKLKFSALSLIVFLIVFLVLFITGLANGLANDSGSAVKDSTAQSFILQKGSESRLNRSELTTADWNKISDKYQQKAAKLSVLQTTIQQPTDASKKTDITYFVNDKNGFLTPSKLSNKKDVIVSSK